MVLARHERESGVIVALPVPVEQIIEETYGLELLYDEIVEPGGTMVLGALFPGDQRIVINTRHEDMFERVIGPERFTLAHELGHWVYDADDPDQLTLDFDAPQSQFCYHREGSDLTDDLQIREVNANKFASHLLLPEHLIRGADLDDVTSSRAAFRQAASDWGVSQQTLRIRLKTMGLLDEIDEFQLDFD